MKKWQIALNKFIDMYVNEPWFEGALLCGSYSTGNNDDNSDIDVYIIADDSINWRERGNKNIDGFIVEYFTNSISQIYKYFEKERKTLKSVTSTMFINGKVLIDKNGNVLKLKNTASMIMNQPVQTDEFNYKLNCYAFWDSFDELETKYKQNKDIDFSYYLFLRRIIEGYTYNKKLESFPMTKIERLINDVDYRKRYLTCEFLDDHFCNLLKNCFVEKERDKKYVNAEKLYEFVIKEFDFDINNFKLRSDVE